MIGMVVTMFRPAGNVSQPVIAAGTSTRRRDAGFERPTLFATVKGRSLMILNRDKAAVERK
jgi:hypothetical protein